MKFECLPWHLRLSITSRTELSVYVKGQGRHQRAQDAKWRIIIQQKQGDEDKE